MRQLVLYYILLSFFVLQAYAVNPIEFLFESVQFILHSPSCEEKGGVRLDTPLNGLNCGAGLNQRNCGCGGQCIISGEWCCNEEVCSEEEFWAVHSDRETALSSIQISPNFLGQVGSFFDRNSCEERGGVKLDRLFDGSNCGAGLNQRNCGCGGQCIISGEWCCNGEVCSKEEFWDVYSDREIASLSSHQISPSFLDQMSSIFEVKNCEERGGVKLDRLFDGLNCGVGKSYRSCRCGSQCITNRQFCCGGAVCDEENFQYFKFYFFMHSSGE